MIARLSHAPFDNLDAQALDVSTIDSSEAIILSVHFGLLYTERTNDLQFPGSRCGASLAKIRKAAGKPIDKPNIVMNAAVQVCCEYSLFFEQILNSNMCMLQGRKRPNVRFKYLYS